MDADEKPMDLSWSTGNTVYELLCIVHQSEEARKPGAGLNVQQIGNILLTVIMLDERDLLP